MQKPDDKKKIVLSLTFPVPVPSSLSDFLADAESVFKKKWGLNTMSNWSFFVHYYNAIYYIVL